MSQSQSGATRRALAKGLVVRAKKTHLEESKCGARNLTLDSFSDGLLKYRANTDCSDLASGSEMLVGVDVNATDNHTGGYDDNFFEIKHSKAELEAMCVLALTTVAHMRENSKEVESYVKKVFGLPTDRYQALYDKAKSVQCPDLNLVCKVISAEGLEAKDSDGKSDPYCKLAILSQQHQSSTQVRQKYMTDWLKAELVTDIVETEVRPRTLEPVWNQTVHLAVKDPQQELLVIEIWDSDEEQYEVTKIRGLKGVKNFFADLRKGVDDFMGRCYYLLHTVPTSGEKKVLDLYSQSAKHKQGTITVELCIEGMREGVSKEMALKEHKLLVRALVDHESKVNGQYVRRWSAKLSDSAHLLLKEHASTSGLNQLQQAGILLNVLLNYHKTYAVKMNSFCEVIAHIKNHSHYFPEPDKTNSTLWVDYLFADLHELASYIFDVMKNHLLVFDLKKIDGIKRLEMHLITLRELYSFRRFTERLKEEQRSLRITMETSIMSAVTSSFSFLNSKAEPLRNDPEERLRAFLGLILHYLHQTQRVHRDIVCLFKEIPVDYFTWYFRALDTVVCGEGEWVETHKGDAQSSITTFELYLALRQLSAMSKHVEESVRKKLKLNNCHLWFRGMVSLWINTASQRCRERIDKAIEIDKVIQVTDQASFSSSAVDTKDFLMKMGYFWKHLQWPVSAESYSYSVAIMQRICDCALYYVGQVYTRVEYEDIYKDGRFHASEKLCIILNNMYHLKQALQDMSHKLELETYYRWLEKQDKAVEKEERVAKTARSLISDVLKSADEDIQNKIGIITQHICQKLAPDIEQFVSKMMAFKEDTPEEDTIAPLLDYLTANLQTLGDYLLDPVFWSILENLWKLSIQSLQHCIPAIPKRAGCKYLHARLHFTVQMLREFYHASGNGLSHDDLSGEFFKELMASLEVMRLSTQDLILRFQSNLCVECNAAKDKAERGLMTVSVGYLQAKKVVEVFIVSAKGLPGMDRSGLSDPFVEIFLLPNWVFPDKVVRTSTKKQTVDPIFNEEFFLPVKCSKSLDTEGAILVMAIFDYDMFASNDLCGICVIPCNRIPKLLRGSAAQRKNFHLPLFLVQESDIFRELESRHHFGDSEANNFFKTYKPYLGELASVRSRLSIKK